MKTVLKMAEELQKGLDKNKEEFHKNSLVKRSTIKSAFEHFLRNNSNKHKDTIKDYNRFYELFKKTFNEGGPCTLINKLSVEAWIIGIKKLSLQQNTIHGYFKQCNHFLNFLFEYNYIPMFKINKDVRTKPEVKEIIVFRDVDLQKIFDNLKSKNSNFRTMIYLAYYTGLRSTDMMSMVIEKINFENSSISYYSPKLKKWYTVPFHNHLTSILKKRIQEKKTGKLLEYTDDSDMCKAFNRYLTELELTGRGYTMRTFRKTFITNASAAMDLATVSKLVGHKNITTTAKYYNKVDLAKKAEDLNKFKGIESAE
jgi:integrase